MTRMLLALGAAMWLAVPAAAQDAAKARGCRHAPFRFCPDCDVAVEVVTRPGGFCVFPYYSGGGIVSQKVVVRPRQGTYGSSNLSLGGYRASPRATGTDFFQVDIAYRVGPEVRTTHLKGQVSISGPPL